ncbi:MAG: hypothetical protein P4L46_16195 [Fimbriimonas sp.]|nr:hypothetical protein [Fimbriimonas sp.]
MNEKTVLAIDPGTSKCGMALVKRNDHGKVELLWRAISPTASVVEKIKEARESDTFELIIVGGGTNSDRVVSEIRANEPGMAILVVDERDTTLQARERYWMVVKRVGWRRFLPSTLQLPPEPVDDFVALILAERVLMHS